MANQLKNGSEGDLHTRLFYEYDSSSSNSRSDSLEFLVTAKQEPFVKEINFAQAMFPEFFMTTATKGLRTCSSETSLVRVNSVTGPMKDFKLSDAIETWYIKEYGLLTS